MGGGGGVVTVGLVSTLGTSCLKDPSTIGLWAYGVVVSMFDFHRSDRGPNPGRGGEIS